MSLHSSPRWFSAWILCCWATVSLLAAMPARAVPIQFTTSTSNAQVFFSGTTHEIAGRVFGLKSLGPVGIGLGAGVFDGDFDIIAGGPTVTAQLAVGSFVANNANFVHPGFGPNETQRIGFTFSLLSPLVAGGASSVDVSYDVLVKLIANGQFQRDWELVSPATQNFNLGSFGVLEASFLTPPPSQGVPSSGGGSIMQANFRLLNPVVTTVPEPSSMWLMGAAMGGWAGLRKRASRRPSQ